MGISVICLIFGIIYECFSHGVYSNYMKYAFVIPLVFGGIMSICIYLLMVKKLPGRISNNLINVYIIIGLVLLIFSIVVCFIELPNKK